MLVGTMLGWVGKLLLPVQIGRLSLFIVIGVAIIAMARELGWISFPLPQLKRQTRDIWGKIFPGPVAAALWGFDLGLFFTTWFRFAGLWLLVLVALIIRSPIYGAALFFAYWLGRAFSVWIAPSLMPNAGFTPHLLDGIAGQYQLFQRIHVLGLVWATVVLIVWFVS